MAIQDDFSIDYTSKRVYHSAGTTVYSVNALYSYLQSTFDDLTQMDDPVPMSAQTPTEYTMINGWFIDDESIKYLNSGAIQTSGWGSGVIRHLHIDATKASGTDTGAGTTTQMVDTAVDFVVDADVEVGDLIYNTTDVETNIVLTITTTTNPNDTLTFAAATTMSGKNYSINTYLSPIASDIGKTVVGGTTGDTGTLLSYAANETGRWEWYVRSDVPAGDLFDDDSEEYTITTGTGKGVAYKAAPTGETLWSNIYTLGTIATDPYALTYVKRGDTEAAQAYVFVNLRTDGATWWNVGHIDVLLKVKDADDFKENGEVTVYARQYGDLYDQFTIDLSAGGRNAVPVATSTDLDNSAGSHYLLIDGVSTIPVVGELIDNSGTFRAEVVSVTDWTGTAVLELGNVIVGDLADNDTLDGDVGGAGLATVNGTLGDTYFEYSAEATPMTTLGQVITGGTSTAERLLRGIQDDGTTGKVVSQVQAVPTAVDYLLFAPESVTETVTGASEGSITVDVESTVAVSGFSDIQIWFLNQQLTYDGGSALFVVGEVVTGATSGATATVVDVVGNATTGVLYTGNRSSNWFQDNEVITGDATGAAVIDGTGYTSSSINKAFTQQAAKSYKVVVDCALRPLSEMYAYFKYITGDGSQYGLYRTTDSALTTYKLYDTSGATYTSYLTEVNNLATTNDVPVHDADIEVGDIVYMSGDTQFSKVKVQQGTQGAGVWTYIWEYWNGAWTALPQIGHDGVPGDHEALHFRGIAGKHYITYAIPTDWVETTVDTVLGYYVRARVSVYTSTTTAPLLNYQQLYGPQLTVDGQVYSEAHFGYVPVKAAPFGTYAGGTYFGARGVWIENMASADIQNYQLKDANNATQSPPNFQNLTVSNTSFNASVGDTVAVFRTTAGLIDKALYTMTVLSGGETAIPVTDGTETAIATDTPSGGKLRVYDVSTNSEQRYRYASWATTTFTLVTGAAGTSTTTEGDTNLLTDSAADFGGADNVEVGDVVRNTTTAESGTIVEIISTTQVLTEGLASGWTSTNVYDTNVVDRAYTTSDTAYVPYIDTSVITTSVTVTVIYASDRPVLTRVRRYNGAGDSILPFETSGTFGSTGYSVATIRTDDAIVA